MTDTELRVRESQLERLDGIVHTPVVKRVLAGHTNFEEEVEGFYVYLVLVKMMQRQ